MALKRELPTQPSHEYGRCPCGGIYESGTTEVRFDEKDVVLTDVPRAICPVCGGRIYKARVLDCIERLYSGRESAV